MTHQEIFDASYHHFITLKSPRSLGPPTKGRFRVGSTMPDGQKRTVCLYRGLGDHSCAIGMFIPDRDYNPAMENMTISQLMHPRRFGALMERIFGPPSPDQLNFLTALQRMHDVAPHEQTHLKSSDFKEFARVHKLDYPPTKEKK